MSFFSLIFAAEIIFSLPFHIPRFFRPDLLLAFGMTNVQLGKLFAWYGVVAMVSYFPGGVMADRFSAKRLLVLSLTLTATGGIVMSFLPEPDTLRWLFAWWGMTTILFFWSAMLKLIRRWGGEQQQGIAFGGLDAGRGAVAASASMLVVVLYQLSGDHDIATQATQVSLLTVRQQISTVAITYTLMTLIAALLVWLFVEDEKRASNQTEARPISLKNLIQLLLNTRLWLLAVIIVMAYCGYKAADVYGLYLVEVHEYTRLEAASFTSLSAWLRPAGALLAGVLADKLRASRMLAIGFTLLLIAYAILAMISERNGATFLLLVNLSISYLAIFALRGVYFSTISESRISLQHTGAAIGFVSFIGYTPDVFFNWITGVILDANSGSGGFIDFFEMMMVIAAVGIVAAIALVWLNRDSLRGSIHPMKNTTD